MDEIANSVNAKAPQLQANTKAQFDTLFAQIWDWGVKTLTGLGG
jgi:hypothetical protein